MHHLRPRLDRAGVSRVDVIDLHGHSRHNGSRLVMRHEADLMGASRWIGQGHDPAVVHHGLELEHAGIEPTRFRQMLTLQVRNHTLHGHGGRAVSPAQ